MTTYEEMALEALAQRGVTVGADGTYARLPDSSGPNPASDAQLRYMNERQGVGDINGRLEYGWVGSLVEVCDALIQQGAAAPWPFRDSTALHRR